MKGKQAKIRGWWFKNGCNALTGKNAVNMPLRKRGVLQARSARNWSEWDLTFHKYTDITTRSPDHVE